MSQSQSISRKKSSQPDEGSDDSSDQQRRPSRQLLAKSHLKHSKGSSSSTKLNKMVRIAPLHGLNDGSPSMASPKSTRFQRSKSTDNIYSHQEQKRIPVKSKSQTRIARHHHGVVMGPSKSAVVQEKRRSQPVLQLENDDSDESDHQDDDKEDSFEDTDDDNRAETPYAAPRDKYQPPMQPKAPAPPQISTETVVAIAGSEEPMSPPTAAVLPNSLPAPDITPVLEPEVVKSRFFDASKAPGYTTPFPVSSWVDLQRLSAGNSPTPEPHELPVSTTTRTQQKLWLQKQSIEHPPAIGSALQTSEQRRELDRISREYANIRNFCNPVVESLERIRSRRRGPTVPVPLKNAKRSDPYEGLNNSLPQRVNSLTATTVNETNSSLDRNENWKYVTSNTAASAAGVGSVTYLLNKMWTDGWKDPDLPEHIDTDSPSIQAQAQQVQQRMAAAQRQLKTNGGINLV
jgi:hypothetical protein